MARNKKSDQKDKQTPQNKGKGVPPPFVKGKKSKKR